MTSVDQATHIVHPTAPGGDVVDGDWCRTLEKAQGRALIHWWYYPDSYDQWQDDSAGVFSAPEPPEHHHGAWHVSERWVRDSYMFNEWCNEEDYEAETSSMEIDKQVPNVTPVHEKVVSNGELQNLSEAIVPQEPLVGISSISPHYLTALEIVKRLPVQANDIVIPSYAAWFDFNEINEVEKLGLPEFFNGKNRSKTPPVYKDYRDFMVNTYRLNPGEYLTFTACRRNLAGDVCAIMRVHGFLEQWGLINYQVDQKPVNYTPAFTGHFRVVADVPRGMQPFVTPTQISKVPLTPSSAKGTSSQGDLPGKLDQNVELRSSVYQPVLSTSTPSFKCATCGVDCTQHRYHSTKVRNYELCAACFRNGRFPSNLSSGDFVRMDAAPPSLREKWSDEETLLLLEGIEMYEGDWDMVAQHVKTRTREQCILQMVQMPIEDSFVDAPGVLGYNRVPLGGENPVMSLVGFLAGSVHPSVASAAAKGALDALGEEGSTAEAAATALGTSAAKAKVLADNEEKEMQKLVNQAVELMLKKVEMKLKNVEALEQLLDSERRELDRQRRLLFTERYTFLLNMANIVDCS